MKKISTRMTKRFDTITKVSVEVVDVNENPRNKPVKVFRYTAWDIYDQKVDCIELPLSDGLDSNDREVARKWGVPLYTVKGAV